MYKEFLIYRHHRKVVKAGSSPTWSLYIHMGSYVVLIYTHAYICIHIYIYTIYPYAGPCVARYSPMSLPTYPSAAVVETARPPLPVMYVLYVGRVCAVRIGPYM